MMIQVEKVERFTVEQDIFDLHLVVEMIQGFGTCGGPKKQFFGATFEK